MLNRVILVGRISTDINLRYTPSGAAIANFNIAVNRKYTNQQGEKETDFIPVVVWRGGAENTAKYCKKGSLVAVDGRIQVRHYENQEGKRVYVTEVVAEDVRFLEPKRGSNQQQDDPFAGVGQEVDIDFDNLPF